MRALTIFRNGRRFMPVVLFTGLSSYCFYTIDQSNTLSATQVFRPKITTSRFSEKDDPKEFVTGHVGMRRNFFNEIVVEGELRNIAKGTSYNKLVLRVQFLSKAGDILFTKDQAVDETLAPGGFIKYKFKIPPSTEVHHLSGIIANAETAG